MPTPAAQLDQLLSTTFDKVKAELSDQITKKTPLLAFLNSKGRVTVDGGVEIRRPLMFALNDTVKSYSGYDVLDTTPQGGIGYATYQWRQLSGSITISGEEERKNSGGPAFISLIAAKIEQLRLSFLHTLNTMLHADGTGNGGKDLLGLQAVVNDSGTLGGIDSSAQTWWKAVVGSAINLTTTAGIRGLNSVFNTLDSFGSRPDIELTAQTGFEAYEALAVPNVRFNDLKMADLGFQAIAHRTAEVVLDTYSPVVTSKPYWYFLNSEHLEFVQHSAAWMKRLPFQQPYNQDARTALVISMGQLITDMRRGNAVIKDVTV